VQSVEVCCARLYTPPVAAPVHNLPLTFKIRHFKKLLVFYVLQPCSRCRGVATGYIHPQSPPPFKTTRITFKIIYLKKNADGLRFPAVQSVLECCAWQHPPPVAAPDQKPPLANKIRHFLKMLVFYVPQPCSRCRGVAPGYIHPLSQVGCFGFIRLCLRLAMVPFLQKKIKKIVLLPYMIWVKALGP